jgi:hypothetical protein
MPGIHAPILQRTAQGGGARIGEPPPRRAPAPAAPPQQQGTTFYPQGAPPPPSAAAPQIQLAPPPQVSAPVVAPPMSGAAPSPGGVPGGGSNVAFNSPELTDYLARVKARLDSPQSDQRALNQAGIAVNEFAQGQRNNAAGDAARRGVFGGGAGAQVQDDIGIAAQGQFAKAAEGIAIARQRDNDSMLLGAQNAFVEPGRQNLADRGLGIQAQGQANQRELSIADMQLRAQMANQNAAQGVASQNLQAQLAAQQLAAQQQMQYMQFYANLYR